MLARMDIISVNCPHTPATYHLLSARRLKLIRKDAYHRQHRARRGDRRERADRADRGGEIAGAGLDVFEHEPAVNPEAGASSRAGKVCCCRIWARPRSRAASTWARR
jgi:glyoxylate reductase